MLKIAINGAAGRMGRRLVALSAADPELEVVAALEHRQCPFLGSDSGTLAGAAANGVPLSAELDAAADVIVDFSVPEACEGITALAVDAQLPLVAATTGLSEDQQAAIREAASRIPIVWAPNMSLAVNLTMKLASEAARALRDLPAGVDVEVIERHHRFKEDAPSGTALRFGELIAREMGQTVHRHGREGLTGKRPADEIGYHALRVGDNPGEHTIVFGMIGETIELTVRATNRDSYALGALEAAKFLARQSPGLFNMYDVLGL
jgi:4-hydroxy-tetrahydrodipicolinate reductase